ncbi:MAG: extracellular solute-binding protein [Trueperaceae bacterium]|nr:MAG: extracellular solute-binding protein [Trueperaceae bacterium]
MRYAIKRLIVASFLLLAAAQAQVEVNWLSLESEDLRKPFEIAMGERFNGQQSDILVIREELENENFKAKLPTLLQTNDAPHLYYSWGGGLFHEQASAGAARDITDLLDADFLATQSAAGVNAFTHEGRIYGLATNVSQVVFFYNRTLVDQAGVDVGAIETWDDFLAAVQQVKDAGITPIAAGGVDLWPLHFYWSYLAMRIAGEEGIAAAKAGEGDGFAAEAFVRAGEEFVRLIELEPFQEGFMTMKYQDASGFFGDGGAAFHLMGNWDLDTQRGNSADGEGLSNDELGIFSFPTVEEGVGRPTDTLGGINGFVVGPNAPDETVEFLKFFVSPEVQLEAGEGSVYIPQAVGAANGVSNPFLAQISSNLAASQWHQVFLDQDLGADVGGVVNDISGKLATGDIDPQTAAELIQESWELR